MYQSKARYYRYECIYTIRILSIFFTRYWADTKLWQMDRLNDRQPKISVALLFSRVVICGSFLSFMFCVCYAFLYVIVALWSPTGKGLSSWLSCVWCFIVFLSLFPVVSWVRCGTWLYQFRIFDSLPLWWNMGTHERSPSFIVNIPGLAPSRKDTGWFWYCK